MEEPSLICRVLRDARDDLAGESDPDFYARVERDALLAPYFAMPGLTAEHFARWLETMEATVDAHAAGLAAEHMKALAHRVALNMQMRLGIAPG